MGYCSKHCTLQTPTHTTARSQMVPLPTTRQLTPCHLPVLSSPASELLLRLQNKANAPLYKSLQSLKVEALDNIKTDCCSRKLFATRPVCWKRTSHLSWQGPALQARNASCHSRCPFSYHKPPLVSPEPSQHLNGLVAHLTLS